MVGGQIGVEGVGLGGGVKENQVLRKQNEVNRTGKKSSIYVELGGKNLKHFCRYIYNPRRRLCFVCFSVELDRHLFYNL